MTDLHTDIDAVLDRLVADPAFLEALADDSRAALREYVLGTHDLVLIAHQIGATNPHHPVVDRYVGETALFALIGVLAGGRNDGR